MTSHVLMLENRPTWDNSRGNTSIIDITIANYNLATRICNWNVDNHLHFSDHYIIKFSINNCSNFRVAEMTDWNYKKGDWVKLKKSTRPRSKKMVQCQALVIYFN